MKEKKESSELAFPAIILSCNELTLYEKNDLNDIFGSSSDQFKKDFVKISRSFSKLLSYPGIMTKEELADSLEVSIESVNEDIGIMKKVTAQTSQVLLRETIKRALLNLDREKPESDNPGRPFFHKSCGGMLYPDLERKGWRKCRRCGKSVKIRGKRTILDEAKLRKEREIEEEK